MKWGTFEMSTEYGIYIHHKFFRINTDNDLPLRLLHQSNIVINLTRPIDVVKWRHPHLLDNDHDNTLLTVLAFMEGCPESSIVDIQDYLNVSFYA